MELEKFRITLCYLNGDMHVPDNKNIIFLFDSRKRKFKTSNSNLEIFPIQLILWTWGCFLGKCTVCSLPLTWKVTPLLQLITAPAVFKKGLPRIIDILSSSGISRITKSVKMVTFATTTGTSSQIPTGIAVVYQPFAKIFQ